MGIVFSFDEKGESMSFLCNKKNFVTIMWESSSITQKMFRFVF